MSEQAFFDRIKAQDYYKDWPDWAKLMIENRHDEIPRKKWPIWAQAVAMKATTEDKGVGDVVARLIGPETSEKFKAFYQVTFGKPCGCTGRQARWNQQYPFT